MRVLLLLSESWNDTVFPNNNMTNWFSDFPNLEIWTISGSALLPNNNCCKDYFLFSENAMIKSLFSSAKAGQEFHYSDYPENTHGNDNCPSANKKLKRFFSNEFSRLIRDFVWRFGHYDLTALKRFIDECSPDIVFSQRMGSVKMCRLEKTVMSLTSAPIIAYSGDDEYSLQHFSLSPVFWVRRFWVRSWLRKTIPNYRLFYCQSVRQMAEFSQDFGVPTKFLIKCGFFSKSKIHSVVGDPIQLVYAGKLYCNRWKTLALIARAIKIINSESDAVKMKLNIYTGDSPSARAKKILDDGTHSIIHGFVTAKELFEIYQRSDIALHVEGLDKKNRLLTKDSFSTKVIDCLSCGCAVLAVCWSQHAAFQYLKEKDAALVADTQEEVTRVLQGVADSPGIILEYSKKAYDCGVQNHNRSIIHKALYDDFTKIINNEI